MHVKRDEQRENLLAAAYELVKEVGVGGLRTRDIADRAGVNVATLHYCFEGKDGLLAALYDFILRQVKVERDRCLADANGPEEVLQGDIRPTDTLSAQSTRQRPGVAGVRRGGLD